MRASNTIKDRIIELRERIPERQSSAWSEKEKCTLVEMFNEGTGITAMALYFCRSEPAIINMLDDMKMYVKKPRKRVEKVNEGCICSECELYKTGHCKGGEMCKKETPAE